MAKNKKTVVDLKPTNIPEEKSKNLQKLVSATTIANLAVVGLTSRQHNLLHTVGGHKGIMQD